jgi:glucokinase
MDKINIISETDFTKTNYAYFILSADIGGNNSYFGVFGIKNNKQFDLIFKYSTETKNIFVLHDILNQILKEAKDSYDVEINRCCIAGAGPVSRRRHYIKMTNVDLEINEQILMDNTMLNKILLVNDFEAIGYGLDFIDFEKDAILLKHVGDDLTKGWTYSNVLSVIGAGSGLGANYAHYDHDNHLHHPMPSEAGHIDFPIHNEFDLELSRYLKKNILTKKDAHPEFERILSSDGMINIFNFIKLKKLVPITKLDQEISKMSGNEQLIAIDKNYSKSKLCKKTWDLFIEYYARFARIFSLSTECYGGLFLTGKMVQKNTELFESGRFMKEFEKHDKRNDLLRKIPVYIIKKDDIGLFGCCNVAVNFYSKI